jgi:AraC-like DNA-binding protein
MDETMGAMTTPRREGFADQRLCVVPRPAVQAAASRAVTRRLVVTDAGWFPEADGHLRQRRNGADEAILMLCVRGSGWVEVAGEQVVVHPSTCVLIPARTPHSYGSSREHPWTIWWCHLTGSDLRDVVDVLGSDHVAPISLRSLDRVTAQFDELVSTLEQGQTPAHLLAATGIAWHLVAQIAVDRVLPETGTPVERAIRYLRERIDSSVRVADLAALVDLSPSHLSALFRHATGGGITAYHIALKMARARSLLDTTSLTVGEVARLVGYDDPLYFSRQFRRLHGLNPTTYRAQRKG